MDTVEIIKQEIIDFDWDNYSLDIVKTADPEYAGELAKLIAEALSGRR
jgi:hypothetical protein